MILHIDKVPKIEKHTVNLFIWLHTDINGQGFVNNT